MAVHGIVRGIIGALDSWRPLETTGKFTARAKCALWDIRADIRALDSWSALENFRKFHAPATRARSRAKNTLVRKILTSIYY